MKLMPLTRTFLWEKAGLDVTQAPPINGGQRWTPVMIMPTSGQSEKSHLLKSIIDNVDGKKRGFFSSMVDALFRGVCVEDFSSFFRGSDVEYKRAHSFKYEGKTEVLHELKKGKKDRIYIYPHTCSCGRFVFLFQYEHKDQQKTSDEVKSYAEQTIKNILSTSKFTITR